MKFSGTVVINPGSADFNGLENPDAEVEMKIFAPANDGSGTYTVKPTGKNNGQAAPHKNEGQRWQTVLAKCLQRLEWHMDGVLHWEGQRNA